MNNDLCRARQMLEEGGYTCVLCRAEQIHTSTARGVRPLLELLDNGSWAQFCAADKVVGKATAFLYVLLQIRAVYTPVISDAALEVLTRHGVDVQYQISVPAILNRRKDGFCPMETAVWDIDSPNEALLRIRATYQALNS